VVGIRRADGHPDTAAHGYPQPLQEERLAQCPEEGVSNGVSISGGVDAGEQHPELVTAEASNEILAAHLVGQPSGNLLEEHVPSSVPESVIHLLETVEIEQQERDDLVIATLLERRRAVPEQQGPVTETGEPVMRGLVDLARKQPRVHQMAADRVGESGEQVTLALGQRLARRQRDIEHAEHALSNLEDLARAANQLGRRASDDVGRLAELAAPAHPCPRCRAGVQLRPARAIR
jgi:hypothetical protein